MPRKGSKKTISAAEEAANAQALDAQAGVPAPKKEPEPEKRYLDTEDGQWGLIKEKSPLTYDTREKLLLKCAGEGFSDEFFAKFTDRKELLDLTCLLGIRRLAMIVCCKDPEIADVKDAIAVMRVVLNMVYGENVTTDPGKFISPPAAVIPTGAADGIDATMDKMKKFSAGGKR